MHQFFGGFKPSMYKSPYIFLGVFLVFFLSPPTKKLRGFSPVAYRWAQGSQLHALRLHNVRGAASDVPRFEPHETLRGSFPGFPAYRTSREMTRKKQGLQQEVYIDTIC